MYESNLQNYLHLALSHCGSCEIGSSLWLCMTCGNLGCSRKNFDGSGGNGHALAHYDSTKHPVVVKIGTITAEGNADVHCYACDEMRIDPSLVAHLKHLGIEAENQAKTEKTIAELV
jgi:ubiquitin carboxyl-terminal hydrolase 5/13